MNGSVSIENLTKLNRIDEEVRKNFNPQVLKDRIAFQMATHSEELFFEEMDERYFR